MNVQRFAIPVVQQMFTVSVNAGQLPTVQDTRTGFEAPLRRRDLQGLPDEITRMIRGNAVNGVSFRQGDLAAGFEKEPIALCPRCSVVILNVLFE